MIVFDISLSFCDESDSGKSGFEPKYDTV